MRQICTSRKVWLPILLLFTAVLIFACWDRGVSIDYDGTGWLCAVPDDGTAVEIPVSFHGTLRRGTYTGSCDIPGVLSCAQLRAQFHGGTADSLFVVDGSGFWLAAPQHLCGVRPLLRRDPAMDSAHRYRQPYLRPLGCRRLLLHRHRRHRRRPRTGHHAVKHRPRSDDLGAGAVLYFLIFSPGG